MPRLPRLPKAGERVLRIPDAATVDATLAAAKPHLYLVLLLCVDAGLRAGEVRGVTWHDVDLNAAIEAASKKPHKSTDPLAPNSRGRVWGESSLAHAVKALLPKLEKESHRFHDLRHYSVASLFKLGIGAPTVRDLAGHRHLQVTALYAHSDDLSRRSAIEALGRAAS